jgi:hypothetical protein
VRLTDDMAAPVILAAFSRLGDAQVSWCLLRGAAELERPDGDVDLLVDPAHADRAQHALEAAGFVLQRSWAGGTQRFFLGREQATGAFVLVHMTSTVSFGKWYALEVPVARRCLERSTATGPVNLVSAPDEFWISILHCLLDKRKVTPKHRSRLSELVDSASVDDDVAAAVARRCGSVWDAAAVIANVREQRWEALEAAAGSIQRSWTRRTPRVRAVKARNAASLWRRKLTEPVRSRGISCALLAPDGAGKSTVANDLAAVLPRPVRVVYLGAYGLGTRGSPIPLPGFDTLVRVAVMWSRWLVGSWHQSRRRYVVFDRHPVELRVGAGGGRRSRLRRRMLSALPMADVVIVLDAPGEVLHRRKPEHDVEALERMRRRYLELAELVPGAVVIDADRSAEEVRRDVAAAIWHCQMVRR